MRISKSRRAGLSALALVAALLALPARGASAPWMADVAYGGDPLQTMDIYRPAQDFADVPFVMFIHAGGWWNGDKKYLPQEDIDFFTSRHIALIAINYRNIPHAQDDHLFPPVLGPLRDAQHALQFLRYHAAEFALDAKRAALMGESAGAFDALWLGLPKDRADKASEDPVARMSTRVEAIGAIDAQTSIDPQEMRAWVGPKMRYGGQAFGLAEGDFDRFLDQRPAFARYFSSLSPVALVDRASPPLFLLYTYAKTEASADPMYYVHSPSFGEHFAAIARAEHVPTILRIGEGPAAHLDLLRFLAKALGR